MRKYAAKIPIAKLRALLNYDPETGVFTWKMDRVRPRVGKVAGTPTKNGYWSICIDQRAYLAHRLAWAYETGEWPTKDIDHWNRIKTDNRFSNLRDASASQNGGNSKKSRKGLKGAYPTRSGSRWYARVQVGRVGYHLGTFDSEEEAHAAYCAAAVSYFGEFARFE